MSRALKFFFLQMFYTLRSLKKDQFERIFLNAYISQCLWEQLAQRKNTCFVNWIFKLPTFDTAVCQEFFAHIAKMCVFTFFIAVSNP